LSAKLYEYAIIRQEKKGKDGNVSEKAKLLERGEVLASSPENATLLAGRAIPETELEHLERITLAVRPF
jgi:hypothetical protein